MFASAPTASESDHPKHNQHGDEQDDQNDTEIRRHARKCALLRHILSSLATRCH